uniref:Uncharacterized protein n=1 Tax=Solanum lycopersicum TaxID=4081 RepID=A0A3Q7E872_SOLLC
DSKTAPPPASNSSALQTTASTDSSEDNNNWRAVWREAIQAEFQIWLENTSVRQPTSINCLLGSFLCFTIDSFIFW